MSYSLVNVDLSTLDTLLSAEGIDAKGTDINNFLIAQGVTTGLADTTDLISFQSGPPFSSSQVENITPPGTYSIDTDQNPSAQVVILDDIGEPPNQNLTVTGSQSILLVAGEGTNTISLQDSGDDLVEVGAGANTVSGGSGADSIYAAGSNELADGGFWEVLGTLRRR